MPKTKKGVKSKYRSINLPEDLIQRILLLIPDYYRAHHETINEWVRVGVYKLARTRHLIKKFERLKKINNSTDTTT
ncbi:hypothetical protein LCGC14_1378630 [marine sediment metagenome]|uniref:Uncharacterized protein n=1 Tax=marine sediment metagenome TaxID=412755 RepID=A0A0F9MIP2_9ZZZZ